MFSGGGRDDGSSSRWAGAPVLQLQSRVGRSRGSPAPRDQSLSRSEGTARAPRRLLQPHRAAFGRSRVDDPHADHRYEEIPHAQGKKNPSKMVGVARGHQRGDTLKPDSQKTSQSNHTRTTALSNSMKLSHAHGATQDGWVMVERSDRMWSTGEGNENHFSILALRTP